MNREEALQNWLADGWLEQDFEEKGAFYRTSISKHESIPFCDGSGRDACVACSEKADKYTPFPCDFVPSHTEILCHGCGEQWAVDFEPTHCICEDPAMEIWGLIEVDGEWDE